jgi:hypothetical protein
MTDDAKEFFLDNELNLFTLGFGYTTGFVKGKFLAGFMYSATFYNYAKTSA